MSDSQVIEQLNRLQQMVENIYIPERNLTLRPRFLAYKSAQTDNVTGDGTVYHYICDTEVYDIGGNYNAGTGVFTAPVDGLYTFSTIVYTRGITASHNTSTTAIVTSAGTLQGSVFNAFSVAIGEFLQLPPLTDAIYLTAAQTAYPQITITGSSKVVDVRGTGNITFTRFSGYLVG